MAHEVFEDHLGVVAALTDNYTQHEDIGTIKNIASIRDEIAELCTAREEDVMQTVEELSRCVNEAEAAAAYPRTEDGHAKAVNSLNASTQEAKEEVKRLQDQLDALQRARDSVKQSFRDLRARSEQLDTLVRDVAPKTRHQLSLYAHVSNVTWDYDTAPNKVAGTVSDPSKGDIQHFEFSTTEATNYDIVNKIWDLIS